MMRQKRDEVLFVVIVVSVISLLFVANLPYFQTASQTSKGPVFVKQLAVQTMIWSAPINGSTIYDWSFSVTNKGRTPITAIRATLDLSSLSRSGDSQSAQKQSYILKQFLIVRALGPPAPSLVRNPPLPFVSSTSPLLLNDTASNGMTLFPPPAFLQLGDSFPVAATITYSNGTLSDLVISAQVVVAP